MSGLNGLARVSRSVEAHSFVGATVQSWPQAAQRIVSVFVPPAQSTEMTRASNLWQCEQAIKGALSRVACMVDVPSTAVASSSTSAISRNSPRDALSRETPHETSHSGRLS